jgi:hypothetical protein
MPADQSMLGVATLITSGSFHRNTQRITAIGLALELNVIKSMLAFAHSFSSPINLNTASLSKPERDMRIDRAALSISAKSFLSILIVI